MKTLVEQMACYEAYHKHPWNKATHFVGIPAIIFSILVPLSWPHGAVNGWPVTAAMALVVLVMAYYFALDVGLALGMAGFILPTLYLAHQVAQISWAAGAAAFFAGFGGGWIFQFIGHAVFEKRRPAAFDNAFQLIIGPIYLVAEVFFLLGFKHGLRAEVLRLETEASGRACPPRAQDSTGPANP